MRMQALVTEKAEFVIPGARMTALSMYTGIPVEAAVSAAALFTAATNALDTEASFIAP